MKETIEKVEKLLNQLERFKKDKEFKKYGFSIAYKYNTWLKEVSNLKDFLGEEKRIEEELLVLQLQNLGLSYAITKGKEVEQLDFSTYKPMAIKEMQKIADLALQKYPIEKIAIHHAEGMLQIGEVPVIIVTSSKHRNAAFEACQFAIDTLKETVPIWKKEHFSDGEVWVNAHP